MGSVKSVILLGAPGSGKGTQAKGLVSKFSTWKHISTGDLFRKEIASKSPLGLEVKDTIDKGNLVSDEITNKVFESQLEKILTGGESVEQIILDGYPRNPGQSRNLLSLIERREDLDIEQPVVVELVVPENELVERLSGRLLNPRNGRVYHKTQNPPKLPGICDDDGGPLIQRADDEEATVRDRFSIYSREADGIKDVLCGPCEHKSVNGSLAVDQITSEIEKSLGLTEDSTSERDL